MPHVRCKARRSGERSSDSQSAGSEGKSSRRSADTDVSACEGEGGPSAEGVRSQEGQAPEPLTKPIQPWVVPETPRRSWIERFGPLAACLALIGLSILTASWSLRAPQPEIVYPAIGAREPVPGADVADAAGKDDALNSMPEVPQELEPVAAENVRVAGNEKSAAALADSAVASKPSSPADAKAVKGADSTAAGKDGAVPKPVSADSSGLAEGEGVVLLRYNNDQREWDRLAGSTSLLRSDRLLCLSPFRGTLTLGKIPIVLTGETEVRVLSRSADKVPAIELIQGRLILRNPPAGSLKVGFSDRTVTLELSALSSIALERTDRREYGRDRNSGSLLGRILHRRRSAAHGRPQERDADCLRRRGDRHGRGRQANGERCTPHLGIRNRAVSA